MKFPPDGTVETENGLVYTSNGYSGYEVRYKIAKTEDGPEEDLALGFIRYATSRKKWTIDTIGGRFYDVLKNPTRSPVFETKEAAARALYVIRKSVQANPLPDPVRIYVEERARALREERQKLIGRFFDLGREMGILERLAKEYNMEFDFGVDVKKEVKDLDDFLTKNVDDLYKQMGKDFARSLRAYVASVVRLVDPEAALEI